MAIPTLTPVSPWPARKLPQSTFDTSVRTSMNQMSTMVSQLNVMIPQVNDTATGVVVSAETAAAQSAVAVTKAGEAAASAETASTAASTATTQAGLASASSASAATSATSAATSAATAVEKAAIAVAAAASAESVTGIPSFTAGDEGKAMVVKPDGSGWGLSLSNIAAGAGGSAVKQTISSDLVLTKDSPRKMVLGATVSGLKVLMPPATSLEQDGVPFIIANNMVDPIQVVDYGGHALGAGQGYIAANAGRAFVLVDKAAGVWAILNLVSASVGGKISETGFILDTHLPVVFESASTQFISAVSLSDTKVLVAYQDVGNSGYGTAIVLTINGTVITVGTPVVFESANTSNISAVKLSDTKVLVAYSDVGNSGYGTAIVLTINGTVITVGTPVVFESANTSNISAVKLSDTKVLVAYSDVWNSGYGTAIVLTINGTVITIGTPVVFESAITNCISAVSLSDTKVLVAYRDNGNSYYVTAIVLTINGTVITIGTPVFESANTSNISAVKLSDTKVLVAYSDVGNSGYGTAIVLTINGTVITVGTPVVFESANTSNISAVKLSDTKVLVAYSDVGNSGYGTAIVLNIDGTSVSLGDAYPLCAATTSHISAVALSDLSIFVAYRDDGNGGYGTSQIITRR